MEQTVNITKALADGNRLRVVMALTAFDELCVCQITELLGVATATVSRHMSVLQNAGLVKSRKDARWVHYRLSEKFPTLLHRWLENTVGRSAEMAADRDKLKAILASEPDVLCRTQRERRKCMGA
jgi:ArsR family transcriptional regulator, arsenate/arsenite/antimonite-responsive transcriptional repressor